MLPSTLPIPALLLLAFLFILSAALFRFNQSKHGRKQPPGPATWPLIGNLHILGALPHRTLQSLANRYGPIMSLQLGQVPTIVISSPEAAELVLKTHDTVFASRPKTQASEYMSYGSKGLVFSSYGPYWRHIRKLCTLQLLSGPKVELFGPLRRQELGEMVKSLEKAAVSREVVDMSDKVGNLVEDITYGMILGRKRDDRFDVKGLVHEALNLTGAFNVADFVPFLGAFNFQGFTRRLKKIRKELDKMLEKIVQEHEDASEAQKSQQKDFVDILLSCMHTPMDDQNLVIDRTNIKAIIFDMLVAAVDTSATAIEWALAELLRHPEVMKKLQHELGNVIGMNRMVEEADLPRLSYLDMVVKETLRLHPIGPLLVPRESAEDVMLDGYLIRKKSRIIVNAWAIGRDPRIWSDNVLVFYPERFINSNIDLRGHDFQLIPFGSGRRGCPGIQLGLTTIRLILAQLVHCFNWELPHGITHDELDMTEKFGLSMPRANHLLALPTYRLAI